MIYGGYDLTFIDIDVQPVESDSSLISEFPPLGSHHTNTNIEFRPGGNGFNLCRTLATLGRKITYVGPSSPLFEQIVENNMIPIEIYPIQNVEVNFTVILNLQKGEVQFNSIQGNLTPEHLNDELISLYIKSPLKSISNISLNSTSIEWICSILLGLIDPKLLTIDKKDLTFQNMYSQIKEASFDGIMFIDPSDLSNFSRLKELGLILKQIKKFQGEKYLSVNEYEIDSLQKIFNKSPKEIAEYLEVPIIFHTSDYVKFYGKENIKLQTNKLKQKKTFVGAGDCFNGAFLHSLFNSSSINDSLKFAINSASHLIETGEYPLDN